MKRLGHGRARAPLPKPPVFAVVGLALRWDWRDVAIALLKLGRLLAPSQRSAADDGGLAGAAHLR
eukprot:804527-Pyramimonas_sp.AAC.1